MKIKTEIASIYFLLSLIAQPCLADCANSGAAKPINYIPTVVTGTASLALSGLGFVTDAALYLTANLMATVVACGIPTLASSGMGSQVGAEVFRACSELVIRANPLEISSPGIGSTVYTATDERRCPMFVTPPPE